MVDVYLSNAADKSKENYIIAKENNVWGVKDDPENKNNRDQVKIGDILILENKTYGAIIGKITELKDDYTPLWPSGDGEVYPYRVKFDIIYDYDNSDISISDILFNCLRDKDGSKYKSKKAVGNAFRGPNGQFRKLTQEEYCCIFEQMENKKGEIYCKYLRRMG